MSKIKKIEGFPRRSNFYIVTLAIMFVVFVTKFEAFNTTPLLGLIAK